MPQRETFALDIKTNGVGAGTAQTCKDLMDKWVQISGTMGGGRKLQIQGTMGDPSGGPDAWQTKIDNIIVPGATYEIPEGYVRVRINTATLGSGDTVAVLSGLNVAREP